MAFSSKIVKPPKEKQMTAKKGYREWLSGVQRLRKYNGRVDLKVKLGEIARRAIAWFRYILLSGFSDIDKVLQAIESGEKPP